MTEPVTFDEDDWASLTASDKKALPQMVRALDFEPLANLSGVGLKSIYALMEKGLVIEGEPSMLGRMFKLTTKGWLAVDWVNGRQTRVYPES